MAGQHTTQNLKTTAILPSIFRMLQIFCLRFVVRSTNLYHRALVFCTGKNKSLALQSLRHLQSYIFIAVDIATPLESGSLSLSARSKNAYDELDGLNGGAGVLTCSSSNAWVSFEIRFIRASMTTQISTFTHLSPMWPYSKLGRTPSTSERVHAASSQRQPGRSRQFRMK